MKKGNKMYLTDELRSEIEYFKRLHSHFSITLGKKEIAIADIEDDKILYILMSASYAMDIFEEGFFENFEITDKALSDKQDLQLDAYAFIETDSSSEKHLHLFQYKLYENGSNGASPVEVRNFVSIMNDMFVHPEFRCDEPINNEVFKEILEKTDAFLNGRRGKKVKVKCHFITNAVGVSKSNEKQFQDLLAKFESDKQQYGFGIQIYGAKEILELVKDGKISVAKESINFNIQGQNSYRLEDNTKKSGLGLPKKVFVGICNVNELVRLQNKYHHNQLYSENIRLYLGDRQTVNKDIISTVTSDESLWFSYMNNGISIICDDMELTSINIKDGILPIDLTNIQIINGCQTVNALYSAKYNEKTKDKFKPTDILVKIYQIDPANHSFKQSIIKASNNQNAVKTYSLLSNDPIQIEIQNALKRIGYLYDRKGEARTAHDNNVIGMVNAALAYRAVYRFDAQKLRAKIGQSRVFQKEYYEDIYKEDYLENEEQIFELASKLFVASIILDTAREYIKANAETTNLPIIKKSAYYLSGLFYAIDKIKCDELVDKCVNLMKDNNPSKTRGMMPHIMSSFEENAKLQMKSAIDKLKELYDAIDQKDKSDIDNLLKSENFSNKYLEIPEIKAAKNQK